MRKLFLFIVCSFVLLATPGLSLAQSQPGVSGYWEGAIDVQGTTIDIQVDVLRDGNGLWKATIGIPSQNLKDYPLSNVKVEGASISFEMPSVEGLPTFKGKLSADGKTIAGELSQSGMTVPFKLERKGDSKMSATDTQAAVIKVTTDVEGNWQGVLNTGAATFRLTLKIKRAADGSFTVSLDSPDQGNTNLPINSLTATGDSLNFEMKYLGAFYQGTLNKERTEVSGNWQQGGASLPLTLKREAKK